MGEARFHPSQVARNGLGGSSTSSGEHVVDEVVEEVAVLQLPPGAFGVWCGGGEWPGRAQGGGNGVYQEAVEAG